ARDDRLPAVRVPDDPQATVLLWDTRRTDLPRQTEAARLQLRSDGTVSVHDPYGPGKSVAARLSPAEMQDVLGGVVHANRFFSMDQRTIDALAQIQPGTNSLTTQLRVCADGREHEIQFGDLRRLAGTVDEARQLAAIEERLERLVTWAYAGG